MESIERPLVSVVLNTRNRSRLLPRSIESALNQTYSNIELIVVDGASSDNTKDVVEDYKRKDKRVEYLFVSENKSAAYCLNLGFKYAKGEFIAILDDDDEFLPEKIEKQMNIMVAGGDETGIVYCWEEFWDDKLNRIVKYGKETARGDLYSQLLKGPCTGGGTLMLVRKTAINKVGGYDDSIRFGADYQFNLNISRFFKHDFVPEVLVKTHLNHEYVHLTTQKGGNVNYAAVIEYYQKILNDHKESFDKYPESKLWHFRSIIGAASNIHNFRLCFKYIKMILFLNVGIWQKCIFTFSSIKRVIISLFKYK